MAWALWAACLPFAPVLGHGDVHGQIEEVSRVIREHPKDVEAHLRRARLHQLDGDWVASAADFDRAEVLAPALATVRLGRGQMLFAAGRLDEALSELDAFVAQKPDHAEGWITRARIEARRGQPTRAVGDFRRGIDLAVRPEPELFVECAQAWASMTPPRWSEAVAVLEQGIGRLGYLPSLGLPALDYELRLGRFDAALARVDRMAKGASRPETWQMRRGDILRAAGRREEAGEAYRDALASVGRLSPVVQARPTTQALRREIEQRLTSVGTSAGPVPAAK